MRLSLRFKFKLSLASADEMARARLIELLLSSSTFCFAANDYNSLQSGVLISANKHTTRLELSAATNEQREEASSAS